MSPARVLLVDDHNLFREGLAGLIRAQPDMQVVGQAADGLEALRCARDLQPDLVVMDIQMPVCDGLEATRRLRAAQPAIRVLILTVHEEDEKLFAAVKAGAHGYMLKTSGSADFLAGLRSVLGGEAVLPPRLAARLMQEFAARPERPSAGPAGARPADLTAREHEVLALIASGATDRQIAAELSVSLYTVKSHVRSILAKLHAADRREAARLLRGDLPGAN